MSLKNLFVKANSADPDEMPSYAELHLGLQCLSMYPFTGINQLMGNCLAPPTTGSYLC